MLPYPGPSGELTKGERRLNWVWYWKVPKGSELREALTDEAGTAHNYSLPQGKLREDLVRWQGEVAEEVLPDVFRRLFAATNRPFLQAIYDLAVPRMRFGQTCLVSDAAFVPRPHTVASTSKAVTTAVTLAKSVRSHRGDVVAALKEWEPEQLELGKCLKNHRKTLGDRSQFDRR